MCSGDVEACVLEVGGQKIQKELTADSCFLFLPSPAIADDPKKTQGIGGDNMTCIIVMLRQEEEEEDHRRPHMRRR